MRTLRLLAVVVGFALILDPAVVLGTTLDVHIGASGVINGQFFSATGTGQGNVEAGLLSVQIDFATPVPPGYPLLAVSMWTSSCGSPIFAEEIGGAVNFFTLTGGNYRCVRTLDFGPRGALDYDFTVSTVGSDLTSIGTINGVVNLPDLINVSPITEVMEPGTGTILAEAAMDFLAADFSLVGATLPSVYTLPPGVTLPFRELRESNVAASVAASSITLDYHTTVRIIPEPAPLALLGFGLALIGLVRWRRSRKGV